MLAGGGRRSPGRNRGSALRSPATRRAGHFHSAFFSACRGRTPDSGVIIVPPYFAFRASPGSSRPTSQIAPTSLHSAVQLYRCVPAGFRESGGYVASIPAFGIPTQAEAWKRRGRWSKGAINGDIEGQQQEGPTDSAGAGRCRPTKFAPGRLPSIYDGEAAGIDSARRRPSVATRRFVYHHQRGSHTYYHHAGDRTQWVTVPIHPGTLKPGALHSIIRQSGLSRQQFIDLL